MALKNTNTVMTDSGGSAKQKTQKPVGYDVYNAGAAAGAEASGKKPGVGAANAGTKMGALAAAKGLMASTPEKTTYTVEDTSARDSYLAALQAQLNAQTAAYDQLLAYNKKMYEEQKKLAAQNREDEARRAYIAKEMALKNLPGQLAREGINGGLAESSYVRLNNRYNSSLADADNAYSDAVNQAYLDMIQANREPQAGKMNAQASYSAGLAKAPKAKTKTTKKDNPNYNAALQDSYNMLRRAGYSDSMAAKLLGLE